jgi:hypothetical protein
MTTDLKEVIIDSEGIVIQDFRPDAYDYALSLRVLTGRFRLFSGFGGYSILGLDR